MAEQETTPNFHKNAMDYVDAQLKVMQKYGSAPILSPAEYCGLVDEIEEVGRAIWERSKVAEPRFPIGRCKGCGKELTGEHKGKADGQTIVYCSYECYCDD